MIKKLVLFFCVTTQAGFSQNFLPSQFYLMDSLDEKTISLPDRALLDSILTLHQKTTQDTAKLRLLDFLVENLADEKLWPRYNNLILMLCEKKVTGSRTQEENVIYLQYKANALNNQGLNFRKLGYTSKALASYQKSLTIRKAIGDKPGIANSLNSIGMVYENQGNIFKALEYYQTSLKLFKETGNKEGVATALSNIGGIYDNQGNIPKVLEFYHNSLKLWEEIGDNQGRAFSLNNLGTVYLGQGDITSALNYFQTSLKILEEIGDKHGMAATYTNLGFIYRNKGDNKKGFEFYQNALKISEEIGDKKGEATSLNNLGFIYLMEGDFPRAREYYHNSLKIREEIRDKQGVVYTLQNMGTAWLKNKQYDSALVFAARSMKLARELGFPENIRNAADLFQSIYRKQKKWEQALAMYDLYILNRDSIKNKETEKATIKQQMKYEYEKAEIIRKQKEKEESRLLAVAVGRRNTLQYSIIVIGLLIIGLIVALFLRLKVNPKIATGLVFISLLIFFEFVLVFIDPWVESVTSGAPVWKLLINAVVAMVIYPVHGLLENFVSKRIRTE